MKTSRYDLKILLRISFLAGIVAVLIFSRNLSAEASMLNYFGLISKNLISEIPSASSIKAIFQIPVVGFIYFDFLDIINVALISILFIPVLYFCFLKKKWVGIFGVFLLLSCLSMYIISNPAVSLYNNLDNTAELSEIINGFPTNTVLSEIALFLLYFFGLFITIYSRKLNLFSNYTFVFGLLTNVIGLLYFPLILIIGELSFFAIVFSAPFTIMWHANIALNLNKIRLRSKQNVE